jgi:MoaA/NifB/PqqE/SkfB family radical SAM enzyme
MFLTLDQIQVLQLDITTFCNLSCPQCSRFNVDGTLSSIANTDSWDMDVIIKNLQLSKLKNLKLVTLEGDNGDVIVHPEINKLIDAIYHQSPGAKMWMITNGSARTVSWWHNLAKMYKDRLQVQFSVDGMQDTNKLYRVGSNYQKVMANAKAFMDAGGTAGQRSIIFKHNEHQIKDIRKKALDDGFAFLELWTCEQDRFLGEKVWPVYNKGQMTHTIEPTTVTEKQIKKYKYTKVPMTTADFPTVSQQAHCPNLQKGHIYITHKGHVISCCQTHADLYHDHPKFEPFKKLYNTGNTYSLYDHNLEFILEKLSFFKNLQTSLSSPDTMIPTCEKYCFSKSCNSS